MTKFEKIEKAIDLLVDSIEVKNWDTNVNSKLHYAIQWLVSAMLDKEESK